jgi:glutamate dehydrogenase
VVACYRDFIRGLLDLTDNVVGGRGRAAARACVRHDGDDPYLVVAADKGTATFSDIANAVAGEYGFWLGDAFASGGSAGYDHKAMGITARGAWESVRGTSASRQDADRDPITVVGIGDMSGDVFGNGMLRSPHLRLVAAFDHRHVFLDPDPDPAAPSPSAAGCSSCRGRAGPTTTARSSPPAAASSRPVGQVDPAHPQVRAVLGIDDEHL